VTPGRGAPRPGNSAGHAAPHPTVGTPRAPGGPAAKRPAAPPKGAKAPAKQPAKPGAKKAPAKPPKVTPTTLAQGYRASTARIQTRLTTQLKKDASIKNVAARAKAEAADRAAAGHQRAQAVESYQKSYLSNQFAAKYGAVHAPAKPKKGATTASVAASYRATIARIDASVTARKTTAAQAQREKAVALLDWQFQYLDIKNASTAAPAGAKQAAPARQPTPAKVPAPAKKAVALPPGPPRPPAFVATYEKAATAARSTLNKALAKATTRQQQQAAVTAYNGAMNRAVATYTTAYKAASGGRP
jgi:hypothetical protein